MHALVSSRCLPAGAGLHFGLQLEPKDLAEQLKRGGAAIPAIRPGKQTAEYVTNTLTRMSLLGSVFLGASPFSMAASAPFDVGNIYRSSWTPPGVPRCGSPLPK